MRNGLTYWEQTRAPTVAKLISAYIPCSARVAFDVGCGSGALTKELSAKINKVIGIDIDYAAVHSHRNKPLHLIVGDAMRLPLRSGSADFLFSYGAMHHTQLVKALTEIVRVTAPDGTVVIIDFCDIGTTTRKDYFDYLRTVLRAFNGYRRRLGIVPAMRISLFRLSPAWSRHQRQDVFLTTEGFRQEYGAILRGAEFYRDNNRMIVVWSRTDDD